MDNVTLFGNVEFVKDRTVQQSIWNDADKRFFSKGIDDPKFRLLKFHTIEATFRIEVKFRTCKYK
ncbi:MAG: pyridoxamine 5'-phosphate oxidase family protein [Treponema sp.]|nr:pyridoxamine 5'-phosphate oxidase family protein [Treponema sp.]